MLRTHQYLPGSVHFLLLYPEPYCLIPQQHLFLRCPSSERHFLTILYKGIAPTPAPHLLSTFYLCALFFLYGIYHYLNLYFLLIFSFIKLHRREIDSLLVPHPYDSGFQWLAQGHLEVPEAPGGCGV